MLHLSEQHSDGGTQAKKYAALYTIKIGANINKSLGYIVVHNSNNTILNLLKTHSYRGETTLKFGLVRS